MSRWSKQAFDYGDFRAGARQRLPRGVFEYIDRGSESETALTHIRAALDAIRIVPSVCTGAPTPDLATMLFGRKFGAPIIVAPTALSGIVCYRGEVEMARACAEAAVPYCLATGSITSMEEVRAAVPEAVIWFHLYVWRDRALSRELMRRAAACGVDTLVVTVDTPVVGRRVYNDRNGFSVPVRLSWRLLAAVAARPAWAMMLARYALTGQWPTYSHYPAELSTSVLKAPQSDRIDIDPGLSWDDLAELRRLWNGNLIIKGILAPADALRAAEIGADGIVVSAHGGRNLDIAPAPATVLPAIVAAVHDRLVVLADSGVQRGTDVLKYIHLGASAVLAGRMPLFGLSAGGQAGATAALRTLSEEMAIAMRLIGLATPADVRDRPLCRSWHPDHPASDISIPGGCVRALSHPH